MVSRHLLGYSKTSRAKCHSNICKGAYVPIGALRYGLEIGNEFGQTVQWRHWGCVTPDVLEQLAAATVNNISGFQELTQADQDKIRLAISLRRIDPSDLPDAVRPGAILQLTAANQSNKNKRKATHELPASSQPIPYPTHSQITGEEIEEVQPVEETRDECYCTMNTNVVGVQYYKGLVGAGEQVLFVREPANPYDRNAIQVKNIGRVQVGHIPRTVASKLAPLLDKKLITVEGVVNDGNMSRSLKHYSLSVTLQIYGASDMRNTLEPLLVWATPGQRGFSSQGASSSRAPTSMDKLRAQRAARESLHHSSTSAASTAEAETLRKQQEALQRTYELKQMLDNLERVDDEGRRNSLLDTLCSVNDILDLPLHPNPPGIASGELTVDLLKHQKQALQWCLERENPKLPTSETDKPIQFWKLKKQPGGSPYYFNVATNTPQESPPTLGRGALCADAMGLGKTLTMIALILATKNDKPMGFSNATLIVSPLSVISNWEKQIQDHCTPGSLSMFVHYGANRSLNPTELQNYDVVITTYQTVVGEHSEAAVLVAKSNKKKKTQKTLFEVPWKRVILDEGHSIRNPKTKMAQAAVALNAQRRWVLSGTPIINSPRDLGSILTFLKICQPLDDENFFKRLLIRPLKNGEPSGAELLRVLMGHICIRRTKEMQDRDGKPIIPLPPVEVIKVPVELSEEARHLYDEVEAVSRQRFEDFINQAERNMTQSNVLSMLTRMRQIALHPGLIPLSYVEELRSAGANNGDHIRTTPLTLEEKIRLQGILAQALEDCEECPICFSVLNNARITSCAHMYCLPCITEVISRDPKCPMDRRSITLADLYETLPPTDLTQKPVQTSEKYHDVRAGTSAKINQLIDLLQLNPLNEKSLVFSQFTSFLDKIAEELDIAGIPYVRFDGQMSAKRRQETLARFSKPVENEAVPCSQMEQLSASTGLKPETSLDMDCDVYIDGADNDVIHPLNNAKGKGKGSKQQSDDNPRVMLISLKAGALGLNLTVANNVYLMDPWWQEGIESQAIDRVNRIGQKKPVHVYQLIAENTIEAKVLEIQERKKKIIQQAFSGMKSTETSRQQREARLQDLVELFGIRQQTQAVAS